jgi:hypothetical protein
MPVCLGRIVEAVVVTIAVRLVERLLDERLPVQLSNSATSATIRNSSSIA